jgi:acyl-CoA reductase-like NAD-dependent aldehyde dehydrogenase
VESLARHSERAVTDNRAVRLDAGREGETGRLLIDGEWVSGVDGFPVFDKYSGEEIARVERAGKQHVSAAVAAARESFTRNALEPPHRASILTAAAALIEERRDEFVRTLIREAGCPASTAVAQATAAVESFAICASEARRLAHRIVTGIGDVALSSYSVRAPRGVVCAITPFAACLQVAAQQMAVAVASGNSLVLKPSHKTPLTATLLARALLDAGIPRSHVNVLQGPGAELGRWLSAEPRIAIFSFAGRERVGRLLQKSIGTRPAILELGGTATAMVDACADLDHAASALAHSAFAQSGQTRSSTQKLLVHQTVFEPFVSRLVSTTRQLRVGDPGDPMTTVGPMIDEAEARRAQFWVREAVAMGARVVTGGGRNGSFLDPTAIINVTPEMRVISDEILAPVISLVPFTEFEEAMQQVNVTPQPTISIFTNDIGRAVEASSRLHAGAVLVNEICGGQPEGMFPPAIHQMTERRLVRIRLPNVTTTSPS